MHGVLQSLRDTIIRFGMNSQPLTDNAVVGSSILKVPMTRRFFEGETVVIRNNTIGEIRTIKELVDEETIVLTENLVRTWTTDENAVVEKAPGGQYIKRIYLGEPDVIPDFPAITITADSRDEEWWTINSTKRSWKCTISCIFEDDGLENSYENMIDFTKVIEDALWANRWPIFGKLVETNLAADALVNTNLLTVDSTSGILPKHQFVLEDYAYTQAGGIESVIDSTHVTIKPNLIYTFKTSRKAKLIIPSRWVMWTHPSSTEYGYIHKGTLLKASRISWTAYEEVVRHNCWTGPVNL